MAATKAPETPAHRLRTALAALRTGAEEIPVERARAIVECAFNAIDVLNLNHATTRINHDRESLNQEHQPPARCAVQAVGPADRR